MIRWINPVDLKQLDETQFSQRYVGCLILMHDNKILLQQRGMHWQHFPGLLAEFGGRIEADETPLHALTRELKEELGATLRASEVISLGAITEEVTNHVVLIYIYFWHDKHNTITGCYEGEAKCFSNADEALTHANMMDGVRWLLKECQKRKLIK